MSVYPGRCLALTVFLLFSFIEPAWGCSCREPPLVSSFERATVVFMGRLLPVTDSAGEEEGFRTIRFQVSGRAFKGDPDQFTYRTASSSATCGVEVSTRARLYLVFGEENPDVPGVADVSICNGTRGFDAAAPGGLRGFLDVPAQQVVPSLIRLSRGEKSVELAIGGVPAQDSPVGLVELPSVLNRDQEEISRWTPYQPLRLYARPDQDSAVMATVASASDLLTRESGYEIQAAVVFEVRDGWLRLRVADGRYGWLMVPESGIFIPLEKLLVGRLGYLTGDWDGRLWASPGAGDSSRPSLSDEVKEQPPIQVMEARWITDRLWLNINLYQKRPCDGLETGVPETGWIPAWNGSGRLTSWYWSRGC